MSKPGRLSESYETEYSDSESDESVAASQPPRTLANWYLEEALGAGYSGVSALKLTEGGQSIRML